MSAANAMHRNTVDRNLKEEVVLKTARRAGWLQFRPNCNSCRLEETDSQSWTQNMPQGSDRVGHQHLAARKWWVTDSQLVPWTDEELNNSADAFKLEKMYLTDVGSDAVAVFDLISSQDFLLTGRKGSS